LNSPFEPLGLDEKDAIEIRSYHVASVMKGVILQVKSVVFAAGFAVIFLAHDVSAQPPDTVWMQTYGDTLYQYGACVQQTIDGGYIVTGHTHSIGASWDVYLMKTNSFGDTLWTQTYGGTFSDVGSCVHQTTDGGYIVAGETASYGAGFWDVYLIKTDSNGDTLWTQTYGGSDFDVGNSVQQTADGGFIVAGETKSFGAGNKDVYLVRTDSNGETIWTQTYGGGNYDVGNSVQQTADGGFIVTGVTRSYGAGNDDVYLVKTDSNGDTIWTQTYGGGNYEVGNSVQQTTDGGYIVSGYTGSIVGDYSDVYLIKTDSNGDTIWTQTIGGSDLNCGECVQQTTDGGYIVAGHIGSTAGVFDVYLLKTDSVGDTLWTQTIGGSEDDFASSVEQTIDGGYIVVGSTKSYGTGDSDIFLIKLEFAPGIGEESEGSILPITLESIDPNPFSSNTFITFSIQDQASVELLIFDISGRKVDELICDQLPAGTHTVMWNPLGNIPSGCYLIEFNASGHQMARKCLRFD